MEDREGSSRVEDLCRSFGEGERWKTAKDLRRKKTLWIVLRQREMEDREGPCRVEDPVDLLARGRWKAAKDLPGEEDICKSSGKVGWWKTAEDLPGEKT